MSAVPTPSTQTALRPDATPAIARWLTYAMQDRGMLLFRLYVYGAIAVLCISAMMHTIGRSGFVLDDLAVWKAAREGTWFNYDSARPFGILPVTIVALLSGNSISIPVILNIIINICAGILAFEAFLPLSRRLIGRWGAIAAFAGAILFALHPSDVSRYWLTAGIGARFLTIELFIVLILWLYAARSDRAWIALLSIPVALFNVLRAEVGLLVLLMIPAFIVIWRRQLFSRKWLTVIALWFVVIGAWAGWRFVIVGNNYTVQHLGTAPANVRPLNATSPVRLTNSIVQSLNNMQSETYESMREEFYYRYVEGTEQTGLDIAALIIAAVIVGGAWYWYSNLSRLRLFNRRTVPEEYAMIQPPPIAFAIETAVYISVLGLLIVVAGALPYVVNGAYLRAQIETSGILSRSASVPTIGLPLIYIGATYILLRLLELVLDWVLIHLTRAIRSFSARFPSFTVWTSKWLDRLRGLALTPALTAFVIIAVSVPQVAIGLSRLVLNGDDYNSAWEVQLDLWQDLVSKPQVWQGDVLIVLVDYPAYVHLAPMSNQSWAYESGVALGLVNAPGNVRIFQTGTSEMADPRIDTSSDQDELVFNWLSASGTELRFPLRNVRVLRWNKDLKLSIPDDNLTFDDSWIKLGVDEEFPLVTLHNNIPMPPTASAFGQSVFRLRNPIVENTDAGVCTTTLPVNSGDVAPYTGQVTLLTYPDGDFLMRTWVDKGTALNTAVSVPCGIFTRLYFASSDPEFKLQIAELPSQYGASVEFGTGEEPVSISYFTSFADAFPVRQIEARNSSRNPERSRPGGTPGAAPTATPSAVPTGTPTVTPSVTTTPTGLSG